MNPTTANRALVLSGGSTKGAFQAGALPVVLKKFKPDVIYGISVGSLNGAFLADRAGWEILSGKKKEEIDWVAIAHELKTFWKTKITEPRAIFKNKKLRLLWEVLQNRFDGIVDTTPLKKLIKETFDMENLANSPVLLKVGAVDMRSGSMFYADHHHPDILEFIYASAAIPGIFPPVCRDEECTYVDGAMRASAPIGEAITEGAHEIVAVLCHAVEMNKSNRNLQNAKSFFERLMDIFSNEQITNDILIAQLRKEVFELENQSGIRMASAKRAALLGMQPRDLQIYIVRPDKQPEINMEDFGKADVEALIELGRLRAEEAMASHRSSLEMVF